MMSTTVTEQTWRATTKNALFSRKHKHYTSPLTLLQGAPAKKTVGSIFHEDSIKKKCPSYTKILIAGCDLYYFAACRACCLGDIMATSRTTDRRAFAYGLSWSLVRTVRPQYGSSGPSEMPAEWCLFARCCSACEFAWRLTHRLNENNQSAVSGSVRGVVPLRAINIVPVFPAGIDYIPALYERDLYMLLLLSSCPCYPCILQPGIIFIHTVVRGRVRILV